MIVINTLQYYVYNISQEISHLGQCWVGVYKLLYYVKNFSFTPGEDVHLQIYIESMGISSQCVVTSNLFAHTSYKHSRSSPCDGSLAVLQQSETEKVKN